MKDAVRLRDRPHRDARRRILIDGARELLRALRAGVTLREVFCCPELCTSADARQILDELPSSVERLDVTPAVFARLAFGDRAEGVLGVAETPATRLEDLRLPQIPLVGVVEAVEKPGNLGAVLRSADAAGVSALVAADPRTDVFNPNAVRASLGTIFTVPLAADRSLHVLNWLRAQRLAIYAARVDGAVSYTQVDFRRPTAIVLGNEAEGLSQAWSAADVLAIRLPMCGVADSLNVSATAAVLFYEALRQRAKK